MIVLDASESMTIQTTGFRRRWDWAVDAAERLLLLTPACRVEALHFGLMMLPGIPLESSGDDILDQCVTHEYPDVDLGREPEALVAAIRAREPAGGSPIAETIEVAAHVLSLRPESDFKTIILISDGEQSCFPSDPATAISRARRLGVRTVVVGFVNHGDPRLADELDLMAQAGGLPRPQRAPGERFFYDATDAGHLPNILADEVCPVVARTERCDYCDNDGDGAVDESPDVGADAPGGVCANLCGTPGVEVCREGLWLCLPPDLPEEVFDCLDNDCDGAVDEGVTGEICHDAARCMAGYWTCDTQACADGETPPCCDATVPWTGGDDACICPDGACVEEVCDGVDQDRDGMTDEQTEGEAPRACREANLVGVVRDGTLRCGVDAKDTPSLVCDAGEGDVIAVPGLSPDDYRDDCDGVDQDLDGDTDEDFTHLPLEARICHLPGDDAALPSEFGTGRLYCATDCDAALGGGRLVCAHPGLARVCGTCVEPNRERCEPPAGNCDARVGVGAGFGAPPAILAQCAEPQATLGSDGVWRVEIAIGTPRCLPRCDGSFAEECLVANEVVQCEGCEVEGRAGIITQRCDDRH